MQIVGSALAQPVTCSVYDKTGSSHSFQHTSGYKIVILVKIVIVQESHAVAGKPRDAAVNLLMLRSSKSKSKSFF